MGGPHSLQSLGSWLLFLFLVEVLLCLERLALAALTGAGTSL